MPSCVLRVSGSIRKVRNFLNETSLVPLKVYWKGDPGFPASRGPIKNSGFNIKLSSSCGESIEKQSRQALSFLKKNHDAMLLLKGYGFKYVVVDFGLNDMATENHPWPSYRIPATLVSILGELGFELHLSFYGVP